MVISFILVNMMNVEVITPSLALFAAKLTSPFVTVFYGLANRLPVISIVTISNTAFPCRILFGTHGTTSNKCFFRGSSVDSTLFHGLDNCTLIHIELFGYVIDRSAFLYVLSMKPIRIMVKLFGPVMTLNIFLPNAVFANPFSWLTTATSAKRCFSHRLIDWLTGSTLSCFGVCSAFVSVALKNEFNQWGRTFKSFCHFVITWIVTTWLPSPIEIANRNLLFGCK